MTQRISRKLLYDLVWSEPMKNLATRFGVSDVALKKTCERAAIPTPDRGYWAKRDSGKATFQAALPPRPPGMNDEIAFGRGGDSWYSSWTDEDLLGPVGAPPEFSEPIETVRSRIAESIGRVKVPHTVHYWNPAVNRLLKDDEKRRQKQQNDPHPFSWNNPVFDTPFERRRLRILNSLFLAVTKLNGRASVHGHEGREIRISFFQQHLHLGLDKPKEANRRTQPINTADSRDTRLRLSILSGWGSDSALASWQDNDAQKLEMQMTDIAVQVILTAEIHYRESALRQYQWRVQRKAELEEEERKRKLEAERAERERIKRIEQGRVDRLLRDAAAFQQAGVIRQYVQAIQLAQTHDTAAVSDKLEQWSRWALAQADRIDPAIGRRFLKATHDEDAS